MELKTCPYPGSRRDHPNPMNLSALRPMLEHWDEISSLLREATGAFAIRCGRQSLVHEDVWQICFEIALLPGYLLFRTQRPCADGQLPISVASAHKTVVGIQALMERLLFQDLLEEGSLVERPVTPEAIWNAAEDLGILVGPHQVCAGPSRRIQEAISAVTLIPPADSGSSALLALLEEGTARWLAFAREAMSLYLSSIGFAIRRQLAWLQLNEIAEAMPVDAFRSRLLAALAKGNEGEHSSANNFSQLAQFVVQASTERCQQFLLGCKGLERRVAGEPLVPVFPERAAERLRKWLETVRSGSAQLDAAFERYCRFEVSALNEWSGNYDRMRVALGEEATAQLLPRASLLGYFGRTPFDVAEELFGPCESLTAAQS